MNLRSAVISLALASCVTASCVTAAFAAAKNTNTFILIGRSGRPVGKASYSIDPAKNGFKVHSQFEFRLVGADQAALPGADPTRPGGGTGIPQEAQYTFEYSTDPNGNFLSGFMQNTATQIMTSLQPSKARDTLAINQNQAGTQLGVRTLVLPKPDFIVAPDFDPAAIQLLLDTARNHPHADSTYLLIVPVTPDLPPSTGNTADYVILQPIDDANGTLDGKPIALKHFHLNYHVGSADLYTDADGNLMEADMTPLSATYVRAKFTLAKP